MCNYIIIVYNFRKESFLPHARARAFQAYEQFPENRPKFYKEMFLIVICVIIQLTDSIRGIKINFGKSRMNYLPIG